MARLTTSRDGADQGGWCWGKIGGGTGQFTAAAGDFTATVTGRGVLPRSPDGSCDPSRDPLHEVDMITATGTLSF